MRARGRYVRVHRRMRTDLLRDWLRLAAAMANVLFRRTTVLFAVLLIAVEPCIAELECPPYGISSEGESKNEVSCSVTWNREYMRGEVNDIIKKEEKKFIRFRTPIKNYTVSSEHDPNQNTDRVITWIWASDKFDYMLFYPQNFQTLSLGTTDIVAENIDNDKMRIESCNDCNSSCSIGYNELKELLLNVSVPLGEEWEYLCIEVDGGLSDIVDDYPDRQELKMLNTRNFALPDILYHARFLKRYFTFCTFFALACKNVSNYYCYDLQGNCKVKEVLSHYNTIIYLAVLLWLYSPILVCYLPSSKRTYSHQHIHGMFPTYKTPVYFGRCIQKYFFCYHTSVGDRYTEYLVRARRAFGFILLATLSFRFLLLPAYQFVSWIIFFLFVTATLWPGYISVYIQPDIPKCFPLFDTQYPDGIIKWHGSRSSSIEYQKLSYIMLERMYMPFDGKFWMYILENCFHQLRLSYQQSFVFLPFWVCQVMLWMLIGQVKLCVSILIVIFYFILPMPYFAKELYRAIHSGVYKYCSTIWCARGKPTVVKMFETLFSFYQAIILVTLLPYFIITLFSLCLLLTEITIFTYIGASIAPDKVIHYFVLMVAFGTAVYTMINSVHKLYSNILKDVVFLLENDAEFKFIRSNVKNNVPNLRLTLNKTTNEGVYLVNVPRQFREQVYFKNEFVSFMNCRLYFSIVETILPIRRQVLLVFVKLFLMVFFIIISMWVKNVYKHENKVSDILSMAGNMAVYFIPTALQFLSSQGQFGRKNDAQQKIDIVAAIVNYIRMKSNTI